jgi:hypothetical protein
VRGSGTTVPAEKLAVAPAVLAVMLHVPGVSANPVICAIPGPSRVIFDAFLNKIVRPNASRL